MRTFSPALWIIHDLYSHRYGRHKCCTRVQKLKCFLSIDTAYRQSGQRATAITAEALTNDPVNNSSRMSYDILTYLRFYVTLAMCLNFAKSLHDRCGSILSSKMVRGVLTRSGDEHREHDTKGVRAAHAAYFL